MKEYSFEPRFLQDCQDYQDNKHKNLVNPVNLNNPGSDKI